MDKLIEAIKSLVSDIESMQLKDQNYFGPFSEHDAEVDDPTTDMGVTIEWPNLAISLEAVKKELRISTMNTKLFLIQSVCLDGNDTSVIVEATDPNDAVNQWHSWKEDLCFDPDEPDEVSEEPTEPRLVFELPEKTGISQFFKWFVPGGVIEHEI